MCGASHWHEQHRVPGRSSALGLRVKGVRFSVMGVGFRVSTKVFRVYRFYAGFPPPSGPFSSCCGPRLHGTII